ncbi:flagellar hook-length control protein FliK [Massilia pseudoviolaceinigra]|uniref:flagellar hook-length control protein FliK n=1 Tax=Massilia pseudoviolaceinigra TaxID=3057165 RepID=UPI0027968678|nr:flagellar hook-length control protein FliK [Massilia sp. CCM 9206]MDQ1925013.1 flagellar hook-length control protein FliK [Massilia sp. CCM 9206]
MLARTDGPGLQPVGKVDPARSAPGVGDTRQEALARVLSTQVGQSMQVAILSKFQDGTFLVRVAGEQARMSLPQGAEAGTEMPMTLVAVNPRPQFRLDNQPAGTAQTPLPGAAGQALPTGATPERAPLQAPALPQAQPQESKGANAANTAGRATSLAATLLGKSPLTASADLPALDATTRPATLSNTGQLLARILDIGHPAPGKQAAIAGATPLIDPKQGAPEAATLARKLEETISRSGVFYESHVAEWADGKRPLSELQREPQMQQAMNTPGNGARPAAAEVASAQLINLQLTAQEQARVTWQGQLAPGQELQWEIHKDAPEQRGRGFEDDTAPVWRSGMRLRFPLLGEIEASIVTTGDRVHIELRTGSQGTGEALRARAGELTSALDVSGTALASLIIRTPEPGDG